MELENYDAVKMKTYVLNIRCVCGGCKRKIKLLLQKIDGVYTVDIDANGGRVEVTGNFDRSHLKKKLGKSATCEMIDAPASSRSVKSAAPSERSRGENSKAGASVRSVKSGGEAQSKKGSKAMSSATMENKSVKSRVSEHAGAKYGGFFGSGKLFGSGKNGGEKGSVAGSSRAGSKKGPASHHSVEHSVAGSSRVGTKKGPASHHSREHSVAGSSRAGSKNGSKLGPMSHHSGEKRSQIGDPYNHQDFAAHRATSPPPPHRESYVNYFSDENPNACNIM